MRLVLGCAILLVLTGIALAQFLNFVNYTQWDRLNEDDRAMYMAGAFDSLTGFSSGGVAGPLHYSRCVRPMTLRQLSENVRVFAFARPSLQNGTVQAALGTYLIERCGTPPQNELK